MKKEYKHDAQLLGARAAADALTNDVGRVNDVVEDCLVDVGAGHRARTIDRSKTGLGDDGALGHEDDVLAKLLLHLHGEHGLDLAVAGTLHEGHLDNDDLLVVRDGELVARDDAEVVKILLEISGGLSLDVEEGFCNSALSKVGVLLAAEDGTDLVLHR